MELNETTLLEQLRILCGTLEVDSSLLRIPQVALSVDEATFAVGQLLAYEPEAVSRLPTAVQIINSLACSLRRGWQIHHGVGKFAANALTVLATCEDAPTAHRQLACRHLLDAFGDWLRNSVVGNARDEEVCGCHCRRASTAACCFIDRMFGRPDELLGSQLAEHPRVCALVADLLTVVRDQNGCPFSLTSVFQIPGVMNQLMNSRPRSHILIDGGRPVRLAEACMAYLSYAMLTVDDHFFTEQAVRCFLRFSEWGSGDGFRRLMSQPFSICMMEGLAPAACCLPSACRMLSRIACHRKGIRCVLSLLLATCAPNDHQSPSLRRRRKGSGSLSKSAAGGAPRASKLKPTEMRRQATLHIKAMVLADSLHPKRTKSTLSSAGKKTRKTKTIASPAHRCPSPARVVKVADMKAPIVSLKCGSGVAAQLAAGPGDSTSHMEVVETSDSSPSVPMDTSCRDYALYTSAEEEEQQQGAAGASAALGGDAKSGAGTRATGEATSNGGPVGGNTGSSPQLRKLQADIENLKREMSEMKNRAGGSDGQEGTGRRGSAENVHSWSYFRAKVKEELKGATCTSLALSTHLGVPPWPKAHIERDTAIGWLLMELLVGDAKARDVMRGQLTLLESCRWLQRRLFRMHQGGQDPHLEEPLVLIECDRKGCAMEELRRTMRDGVGIFGDVSGQIEATFLNEPANGPAVLREWFVHMSQQIAHPKHNLLRSTDGGVTLLPSPSSAMRAVRRCSPTARSAGGQSTQTQEQREQQQQQEQKPMETLTDYRGVSRRRDLADFYALGRLVGLGVFRRVPIGLRLHRAFCRLVMNGGRLGRWSYNDVKALDPVFYKNKVQYLLDNPVEDLDLVFTDVLDDRDGAGAYAIPGADRQVPLIANGESVAVTDANKADYVRRVCEWRLEGCMREQTRSFLEGLHTLVPRATMQGLNAVMRLEDFENLVAGLPDIDAKDWQKHSRVSGGYTADDEQVVWFWELMHEFTLDQRSGLLHFVTGSRNPPVGGFARLQGFNGDQKFTISKIDNPPTALPSAHACICTIDIPPYTSKAMLRERLLQAVLLGGVGFNGHDAED